MNMNEEYKMLREEIMFNSKQVYLYFTFTVLSVSTMLAYVFKNINKPNSNSIFIAIFVLLICATTRVKRLLTTTISISTYMEVFLEPDVDERNWETRSHYQVNGCNSRELDKRNPWINIMFFKSISPWFLLSIITYVLYVLVLYGNDEDPFSILISHSFFVIFVLVFNTIIFFMLIYITLFNDKSYRDKYLKHWKEVKTKMEGNVASVKRESVVL